jgi:hypothetical protein
VGCGEVILDEMMMALDAPWHRKCFTCVHCMQPLEGTQFYVKVTNSILEHSHYV